MIFYSDGLADIIDALVMAQVYVGLDPAGFDQSKADTNCDGSIDIVDALLISQYYVGLVSEFYQVESCIQCPEYRTPGIYPELRASVRFFKKNACLFKNTKIK